MNAQLLRPRGGPHDSRSGGPYGVCVIGKRVQIEGPVGDFVLERLRVAVVKGLQRSGNNFLFAPCAVATTIGAKVLAMRLARKFSKIEVRVATMRTGNAVHRRASLKRSDKLESCGRGDVDSRDLFSTK